jgi:hypothetical protein
MGTNIQQCIHLSYLLVGSLEANYFGLPNTHVGYYIYNVAMSSPQAPWRALLHPISLDRDKESEKGSRMRRWALTVGGAANWDVPNQVESKWREWVGENGVILKTHCHQCFSQVQMSRNI